MLLRASGEAIDEDVRLEGSIGEGDGGLPHGAALLRFAEAATRGSDDLAESRSALIEAVGGAAFIEAAATVAIFNGLVRVADATGVPLDEGTRSNSAAFRERLGLDAFGSARNTDLDATGSAPNARAATAAGTGVLDLFGAGGTRRR